MPVVKLLLNSVISTPGARFMTAEISDFYLGTPLPRPEYLRISEEIIRQRNLGKYILNGAILFEINKGMYGLPQAGLLAQERLMTHLAAHGYTQTSTPCLFRHATNGVTFTLVVDDFGVKYTTLQGAEHLCDILRQLYTLKPDYTGSSYIGFRLDFNYINRLVTLSMPTYVDKMLLRFLPDLVHGANTPAIYTAPQWGGKQIARVDTSEKLPEVDKKFIQEVVGSALYYARGIDHHLSSVIEGNNTNDGSNACNYETASISRSSQKQQARVSS